MDTTKRAITDGDRVARLASLAANRRSLFKFSAGSMAALALSAAFALDSAAQDVDTLAGYEFFTGPQADTIGAIADQYWPPTETSPGGKDAGVVTYIDRSLATAYSDYQMVYHAGLGWLDAAADQRYQAPFVQLDSDQQFELITAIFNKELDPPAEEGAAPAASPVAEPSPVAENEAPVQKIVAGTEGPFVPTLSAFMSLVLTHTMEGLFSDPAYGGNRNFAGWKAIGYPGPYVVYTEEQQQSYEPLNLPLQSIADF